MNDHHLSDAVGLFIKSRETKQCAASTITLYGKKLDLFVQYCCRNKVENMQQLSPQTIREFMIELNKMHSQGGTYTYVAVLRIFMNWYTKQVNLSSKNPMNRISQPKKKQRMNTGLSLENIKKMLKTSDNDLLGLRDQVIIRMLLETGIRPGEMCNLRIMDLDLITNQIYVIPGERRRGRYIPISQRLSKIIIFYLKQKGIQNYQDFVFSSRNFEQPKTTLINSVLRGRAKNAGIKEIPTAHNFRKTYGLMLIKNNCTSKRILDLLGHSNVNTLKQYEGVFLDDLLIACEKATSFIL